VRTLLLFCTHFSLQHEQHRSATQRTSGVLPSCRRRVVRVNPPPAISIAGRQSLVAFDQQDQQREGYRLPYRQRGGKTSAFFFFPPLSSDTITSQVTTRAANLLVGNLPRNRIENLLRFYRIDARVFVQFALCAAGSCPNTSLGVSSTRLLKQ
jgi:hypothetical protein